MVKVIVLVMALNMDAFAVSIELGTKHAERKLSLGLMAGLYFDMFQGLMSLTGYAASECLSGLKYLRHRSPLYCLAGK